MSAQATATGKSALTPFNLVAGILVAIGVVLTALRFTGGLGAVTNLDHNNPWGVWIAFDLLCGVALAAGGYTTSAACYIFGFKKYHSAVRPAVLTAFLGYALVVLALHYDVGRPWRLPYPILYQQGTTSVLFEVGLCVFLYLIVLFIEYCPAALEWLGLRKLRNQLVKLTLVLTIFGVILSTMHQSSLGSLFLIAPSKIHPLWYSGYLPVFFFVSSVFAGLSMVIFESTLSHHYYHDHMDDLHMTEAPQVTFGFARGAAWVMGGYFAMKVFGLSMDNDWHYLNTGFGAWYLIEVIGFVALPCFFFAVGARDKNVKLIRWTALWTVLGIVLNRFNVCLVAFNWQLPSADRYFPSMAEIGVSIFLVTVFLLVFRFIVKRMPIFHEHPEYKESH